MTAPNISVHPYDDPLYKSLPCTREAIDDYLLKRAQLLGQTTEGHGVKYPDEWYQDKNNRCSGKPTGWLRIENGQMVWRSSKAASCAHEWVSDQGDSKLQHIRRCRLCGKASEYTEYA